MNKTSAAHTLHEAVSDCLPADSYDILVILVALHMHDHPRHQTKNFMARVQQRLTQLRMTKGKADLQNDSPLLDPSTVRIVLTLSGTFLMVGLLVFGVVWASVAAYLPETYWSNVTVFMAAYGLFVFVQTTGKLVVDMIKTIN